MYKVRELTTPTMKIDLQGQYGFSPILQVLQQTGEGGDTMAQAPGPGEGGYAIRGLISKIGSGEGGKVPPVEPLISAL